MVYLEKVGTDPFIIKQSPDTDCVNATRHIVFSGIYFYRLQADFLYIEIAGLRIQCHTGNIETVVTCRHLPADAGCFKGETTGIPQTMLLFRNRINQEVVCPEIEVIQFIDFH